MTRPSRLYVPVLLALTLLVGDVSFLGRTAAEAEVTQVYVVDANDADASDENPGTAERPVRTIGRALALADRANRDGLGTRVEVRPGVYREALKLGPSSSRTAAPLVIEGTRADQVVLDGADVWKEWRVGPAPGVFVHHWPHAWGLSDLPSSSWESHFERNDVSDLARRREAVWVDGVLMRQVLSASELAPATYHVDESEEILSLYPPTGVDLHSATVDVAVRGRLLDVDRWDNVTVRGITFRRTASPLQSAGARFVRTRNLLIEDARFDWHNWTGLALQDVVGATIRRVSTSHNGVLGLSVYRSESVSVLEVDNSYNNTWRGHWAGFYGWETGSKVYRARNIEFDRWYAVGNQSNGMWLDTDVANATIRRAFVADNRGRGLFLEAIQGPTVVEDTTVCRNGNGGIVDGKSDGVTLLDNRVFANDRAQLIFSGPSGGRSFKAYDSGDTVSVHSVDWTLRNNVLEGGSGARVIGNNLQENDWEIVRASLEAGHNRYHHATDTRPFTLPGRIVGFAGWRSDTGQDTDSTFSTSPSGSACSATRPDVPPAPDASVVRTEPVEDGAEHDLPGDGPAEGSGGTQASCADGVAVTGDWDGDGRATPGCFQSGLWTLRMSDGSLITFSYGKQSGDVPVTGDWNGNGRHGVGVHRAGRWHLRNSLSSTPGHTVHSFEYGKQPGDVPVTGDWNGNGRHGIGVHRNGWWHLRNSLSSTPGHTVHSFEYGK